MSEHKAWGLDDEIRYLRRIGQHSDHTKDMTRSEILKNYLHAQLRRTRWDNLDRKQAIRLTFDALQKSSLEEMK